MSNKPQLKVLKNIAHSLIHMIGWLNPLERGIALDTISFEIDLLTGNFDCDRDDTFGEIYSEKHRWFVTRCKELGILAYIASATLNVQYGIERVKIKTKDGRVFGDEITYRKD